MVTEKKTRSTAGRSTRTGRKSRKFSIEAPLAQSVAIAGSFNDWTPQAMKRSAKGAWSISVSLTPGSYQYKFVVDEEWLEDPACEEKAPSPFGGFNSVCSIP
jgi:1,4-alpha-glucan branching enzyme